MDRHDSKYWGLFENRPAKERASAPIVEKAQKQSGVRKVDGNSRIQRSSRAIIRALIRAEHLKC